MSGFRSPKFLIVTGAVLISVGVGAAGIGMLWGMSQAFRGFGDASQLDRYCREGETPVHETSSAYVPGVGHTTTTQVYCEDGEGHRRPVMDDFMRDLFGRVAKGFALGLASMALLGVGFVLLFAGLVIAAMKRRPPAPFGA